MHSVLRFTLTSTLLAVSALSCRASDSGSQRPRYPATRTVEVTDDYHGTRVADPYRWLEELASAEVRDWAAAQTALALPFLRDNDLRPWLVSRFETLGKFWEEPSTGPASTPLIDEQSLGAGNSLDEVWKSPDGKLAAYTVSQNGSEWVEARIRRLADGKDLDEKLDGLLWSTASWTRDSRGFFYERSVRPAVSERTALKGPGVYYHVAGTPQTADVAIYKTPPDGTDLVLEQELSEDGRYLYIYEGTGADVEGLGWMLTRPYVLDLRNADRPVLSGNLQPLSAERDAAYRVIANTGDTLFVFTDRDAPRRRIVAFDLRNPAPKHWRDVVPQSDGVIDEVQHVDGRFLVTFLRDLQHGVRVYSRNGTLVRELAIPPMTAVTDMSVGANRDEMVVSASTRFSPTRTRHNLSTGAVTVERAPKLPPGAENFEAKLVWFPSRDSVRVPMFLLHRRGIALDGSHPTILSGYGASSQMTTPTFGAPAIALLELGMVLATPAIRGGGELGRTWYEAATLEKKQRTFDDFIAAAEYLIREGYTSAEKLAIQGTSNGGLLVAAVINQRPDLFRVAIAGVPQTDALRYNRGRHNAQFGSTTNPAHVPFLLAYSPQHNIRRGVCYPSTLITTALNDDRASAWMALKFAAALQAAQACNRPILLRADTSGGHEGNAMEDGLDLMVFTARELGVKVPRRR